MGAHKVRLVHWKGEEAQEKAVILEVAGFQVGCEPPAGSTFLKELEDEDPAAVLIDLSRIPSQGRDLAVAIRKRKGTRQIPIVFVGGESRKWERIRSILPDAVFTNCDEVVPEVKRVIHSGSEPRVVPDSIFAAYAGQPLPGKLGIRKGSVVSLISQPEGFTRVLGRLPQGASLVEGQDPSANRAVWFLRSVQELRENRETIIELARTMPVWLAWPKGGSGSEGALTQNRVREIAMKAGLVDYKICSIDKEWSALLFTWRVVAEKPPTSK